jgi:MYXO-CTERM domain-containing protein
VTAAIGQSCSAAAPCPGTDVCVDGRCVAGSGEEGGLGSVCGNNEDCQSGSCGSDGTNGYCVEVCDPAANACPAGFECMVSGAQGVCWPSADSGGCSSGGTPSPGWFFLAAGLVFVLRRRIV